MYARVMRSANVSVPKHLIAFQIGFKSTLKACEIMRMRMI